jgi:hypothetical protein
MLKEEIMRALEEEKLKEIAEKYHVSVEQVGTAFSCWDTLFRPK